MSLAVQVYQCMRRGYVLATSFMFADLLRVKDARMAEVITHGVWYSGAK